jgi:trehalose-6-phosphatase
VWFVFDVDGAIVEPNQHILQEWQKNKLSRLVEVTDGAVTFLTNNSGASVHKMYPHIQCVSEFGLVWRKTNGEKSTQLGPGVPSLDFDAIRILLSAHPQCSQLPWIEKEASANFVYNNEGERVIATQMAHKIMDVFNLGAHYEIITLVDSVEIVPVGAEKSNAIGPISNLPEYTGRKIIMVGDSPADHKCMAKTGFGVAVGNAIQTNDNVIGRVPSHKQTWTFIDRVLDAFERSAPADIGKITTEINTQQNPVSSRQGLSPTRSVLVP